MNLTHPSIVITTPRNRYARRSEGRYLEQKVTGNPLKLRPRSGYYSAFFPSLQAASLLMQEALRVHGHSFVYQISHVSQSHLTYCHMLFQSAQHPLASIWCLLAASANLNCHYLHTGLYWKCPKAFTTNTLRKNGGNGTRKEDGWAKNDAALRPSFKVSEKQGTSTITGQDSPTVSCHWTNPLTVDVGYFRPATSWDSSICYASVGF